MILIHGGLHSIHSVSKTTTFSTTYSGTKGCYQAHRVNRVEKNGVLSGYQYSQTQETSSNKTGMLGTREGKQLSILIELPKPFCSSLKRL